LDYYTISYINTNIKQKLHKKKKEKGYCAVGCLETGPQTGPLLPARIRAAHARALSLSLTQPLTG